VDGFASFTGQEERALGALMRVAAGMKIALCLEAEVGGGRREAGVEKSEVRSQKDGANTQAEYSASASSAGSDSYTELQNPNSKIENPQSPTGLSMFALLRETYARLTELARAEGQLVVSSLLLPQPDQPTRFSKAPALALLEQRLFAADRTGCQPVPLARSVVLTEAADQRSEVRDVACEILRLCREEGYRFRDIAVIARDLVPYQALIETIFHAYEIPHFVDVRLDVAHHPLVELVRSAMAVVAKRWPSDEVIRYAKTDLPAVERAAVDRLENYVLEHGIEGDAWYREDPWRFHRRLEPGDEGEPKEDKTPFEEINTRRLAIAAPLRRFEQAARPAVNSGIPNPKSKIQKLPSVFEISRALFGLLEEIGAAERLEQWAAEAEKAGRLAEADEHRQVWDAVVDLLDQAVAALGNEPVTLEEYRELIEAGLEGIRLRLVPPALDEVLVGSIERSRHPEIRAAFVLGVNERVFPRPQLPDVIFGDRERDRLARDGLLLGPVSEKRLLHEQFLAYIAFTRGAERLCVSFAKADPMGKVLHPSPYLDELRRCLPELIVRRVERDEALDRIAHWRAALAGLAAGLRPGHTAGGQERATWLALYGEMRRDGELCGALGQRVGGLAYENRARLSRPTAQQLYGGGNESSVSRLECFAACPFKHFARYGLALEERLRFRLEHFDLGLLYHAVLKDVFEQLAGGKPLDWGKVEPQRAVAAVSKALEKLAPQLRNEILLSSGRNRYLLEAARAALTTFVRVLIAASQHDGFSQAAAEVSFGRGEGNRYGPLEILLGEGDRLLLRGRIDRIDVGGSDRQVIRVIDYKSHYKQFRAVELAHGLALQLPTYLMAVERGAAAKGKRPTVAGALYVPILRGISSVASSEATAVGAPDAATNAAAEALDLRAWKARGVFDFRWAALFDAEVAAHGGRSEVVALAITKEGKPYAGENWDHLADESLNDLLRWTEQKAADLGRRIVAGEVAVSPYQLGHEIPCTWCEFLSVCRFDGQRQPYRVLPTMSRTEAIEWIKGQRVGRVGNLSNK